MFTSRMSLNIVAGACTSLFASSASAAVVAFNYDFEDGDNQGAWSAVSTTTGSLNGTSPGQGNFVGEVDFTLTGSGSTETAPTGGGRNLDDINVPIDVSEVVDGKITLSADVRFEDALLNASDFSLGVRFARVGGGNVLASTSIDIPGGTPADTWITISGNITIPADADDSIIEGFAGYIVFAGNNTSAQSSTVYFDNFTATYVIPEPGSMALVLLGALAVLAGRHKRQV